MGLAQAGQVVGEEEGGLVQAEQVVEEREGLGPVDVEVCWVRTTEELKGLEWLISNSKNKLCYPLQFPEMNLETDLQVDIVNLRREFSMEIILRCVGSGQGFGILCAYC